MIRDTTTTTTWG